MNEVVPMTDYGEEKKSIAVKCSNDGDGRRHQLSVIPISVFRDYQSKGRGYECALCRARRYAEHSGYIPPDTTDGRTVLFDSWGRVKDEIGGGVT